MDIFYSLKFYFILSTKWNRTKDYNKTESKPNRTCSFFQNWNQTKVQKSFPFIPILNLEFCWAWFPEVLIWSGCGIWTSRSRQPRSWSRAGWSLEYPWWFLEITGWDANLFIDYFVDWTHACNIFLTENKDLWISSRRAVVFWQSFLAKHTACQCTVPVEIRSWTSINARKGFQLSKP